MAAVAEAMALGISLGLDPKTLAGIFNTSSARCWSSDSYNPVPVDTLLQLSSTGMPVMCWCEWLWS